MKKYVVTVFLFFTVFLAINAQNRLAPTSSIESRTDSVPLDPSSIAKSGNIIDTVKVEVPNIYAWKITPRLGERVFVPRDTVLFDFHESMLVDGQSVAMGYLGNIGSPAQSKIFFDRPDPSAFSFLDAMYLWRKNPEDHYFLNTKIPYSNIKYQSGGGGENAENRFQSELSMNMGKKLNVGFDFDYVYSRGQYNSLSNKQMSYDFYASYIGDKYKMHAFFHNNNFNNIENGGIRDTLYISNPEHPNIVREGGYSGNPKDIPTRMQSTHNKMRGRHLYVTNRYDLGNDMEEYQVNDSTKAWRRKENYVPLASAIFTTHYTDQRRRITSSFNNLNELYFPYYNNGEFAADKGDVKYSAAINDYMSYYSFKNTLALAMNEGFRSWTKFGLTAFIEHDMRKYSIPGNIPGMNLRHSENVVWVGGILSKEKGKYLRYRASGQVDVLGKEGFKLEGEVTTMLDLFGKSISAKANTYIKSVRPSFFQRNFSSKYWNWSENFDNTQRGFVGGEIVFPELPFSKTRISGGVETVKNYVYADTMGITHQASGDVQVFSIRLDQNLKAGIFHWDNQIVYQKSTKQDIIPLPDLSIYSNIYLSTKIAEVLTLQLGLDAHFHTQYYMPGYDPLTMQFFNQNKMELGNFPIGNAYVNLHLKYTRFYIMMYNVFEGMGNSQSFSLYRYPVNPRGLKLGISWQFNN